MLTSASLTHEPAQIQQQTKEKGKNVVKNTKSLLPEWRLTLESSLRTNFEPTYDPANYYVSLATIKAFGRPANRTIYFRGFLDQCPAADKSSRDITNEVVFTTDIRSSEIQDIHHGSRFGEINWFMQPHKHQFRISGEMKLVLPPSHPLAPAACPSDGDTNWEDVRQWYWKHISSTRRASFAWPEPGSPITESKLPSAIEAEDTCGQGYQQAIKHFCLLIMNVDGVDYLDLGNVPHKRIKYRKTMTLSEKDVVAGCYDDSWEVTQVNA